MTTILKLKKNIYSLIGITSLIFFSQTTWAANPTADCTVSGAGVVTQVTNGAPGKFDCFAQPDSQKVKFYKVMLCTSAYNGAVTDALGPNTFLGDCTTLYESTAGDEVNVTVGVTSPLTGTLTPVAGTYSTLYVEADPTFKYTQAGQFNAAMTYQATPGTAFCATNATAALTDQVASPANVTCNFANLAAAEAGKLETSVTINDLNNNQAPRSRSMMQSVTSLSNQTFSAALINPTTHNLITWPNGAANPAGTRLAAWMANPITITPAQALAPNFTLTFSNSRGISTLSNTVNQISGVHPGAFDMVLTIQ
ncbi:hypothetical protein LBMAG29_09900 [Methylophilaceae bacterium]|nr:hypothetical protein LBMAG29_09900 [Methylophilaceae bacterium]